MLQPPNKPDQTSSSEQPVLLTVADIIRLKAEYEADVRLFEELPARIKLKRRRYEAALLFAPPGFDANAPLPAPLASTPPARAPEDARAESVAPAFDLVASPAEDAEDDGQQRVTWINGLERLLAGADRGISHRDALAALKQTALGERSSAGEKGFYNAVARLEQTGRLVKNGGLLYSPRLVAEMKARGQSLPDVSSETRRRAGGSATVVLEVLRRYPEGLDATSLRDEVIKEPGMPASLIKHGHYIYNVLATLMGQGEIRKDERGVYLTAPKGN